MIQRQADECGGWVVDPLYADEEYCYLTTRGRVTGREHTIEIWFAVEGSALYMLSGGGAASDWVKNSLKTPSVTVRIGDRLFCGEAHAVTEGVEDALARRLLLEKYRARTADDLDGWGRTALPMAVDLALEG